MDSALALQLAGQVVREVVTPSMVLCTARAVSNALLCGASTSYHGTAELQDFARETDLALRVHVMVGVLEDLQRSEHGAGVEQALAGLQEALAAVHRSQEEIQRRLADHGRKWVASWRVCDLEAPLAALRRQHALLESRFALLLQVVAATGPSYSSPSLP